jgi:hypothetical protein
MKKRFLCSRCLPAFLISLGLIFTLRVSARVLPPRMTLPLAFEANCGQADAAAEFLERGENYSLFLTTGGGATLRLSTAASKLPSNAVLRLRLVGARGERRAQRKTSWPGASIISWAAIRRGGGAAFRRLAG